MIIRTRTAIIDTDQEPVLLNIREDEKRQIAEMCFPHMLLFLYPKNATAAEISKLTEEFRWPPKAAVDK